MPFPISDIVHNFNNFNISKTSRTSINGIGAAVMKITLMMSDDDDNLDDDDDDDNLDDDDDDDNLDDGDEIDRDHFLPRMDHRLCRPLPIFIC